MRRNVSTSRYYVTRAFYYFSFWLATPRALRGAARLGTARSWPWSYLVRSSDPVRSGGADGAGGPKQAQEDRTDFLRPRTARLIVR